MQKIKNWRDYNWSRNNKNGNLSFEEEVFLCYEVNNGNREKALNILIDQNINMVHKISKKYLWCNILYEDLLQYGVEGLISAAQNFVPEKGYKYNTLAGHYVLGRIRRAIEQHNRIIKVPAHVNLATLKLLDIETEKEVTDEMLLPMVNKRTTLNTLKSAVVVKNTQILEIDSIFQISDAKLEIDEKKIAIEQILQTLRPIEITCIKLKFGLDNNLPLTYKEIDKIVSADSEGLINRAMIKLRNIEGIEEFLRYLK